MSKDAGQRMVDAHTSGSRPRPMRKSTGLVQVRECVA